MIFDEILAQIIDLLQRQGRVSYGALKRRFDLDDDYLKDLKDEILYVHPVVDDEGKGLIWTGSQAMSEAGMRHRARAESRFHALLRAVMALLQRERRVSYRELKYVFDIDDALLEEIGEELLFKRFAIDDAGQGLVWAGEDQSITPSAVSMPAQSDNAERTAVSSSAISSLLPPPVTGSSPPSNGPTIPAEVISTDTPQDGSDVPTASHHPSSEAERRQLTVMFCDLADSTKLSHQLDPEDLREVVRAYQATAAEAIQQYEGHMAQYLGDGLLIYFGWPVAHEDDAQRSLHAGLGIVQAITTALNPRLKQEKGVQLAVRIGIHTGPVVVGEMGSGGRHENLATGETVNIAARLEGLAAPNTALISSVTARLVERAFVLEALGPQMLKGVADPLDVFRVLDAMADDEDEMPTVGVPFLVGRDEEVGLMLRRWEQSKEGLGQVVLIRGEAGIGKSSLVATVRHHVVQTGYTRIAFRCSPYHTNSTLYPVIEHIQRVLQFEPGDTPATRLDKLERVLKTYSRPLEDVVPLYTALLSVPLPEERYTALNLSPQQQRQQTQDALVGWLLEEAERQPTLAMWEDLHWADPSTLELLGLVLEQTPTVPMLHVLTYRPEFEPPWPARSHMTPITLNRLERPQVEALMTHLADDKALPDEVIEHIVVKTDGVPLYVEEMTKMLLESDLVREESEQYILTGPLASSVAIPDTLQDSLMARLDQMHTAKEVAQLGAVLGREFSYDMLQAISSQNDATLQASLAQLVGAELLYQRGRPPRAKYLFKHALIQDAAYASLLKNTRQRVHQKIALLLESRFPELVETQPELVAHHYTEAGQHERAVDYWRRAGHRAAERSAHVEAVAHLSQGLTICQLLPETPERIQHEVDLQLNLGLSLRATKGYTAPEVQEAFDQARRLCEQTGDITQSFRALGVLVTVYANRGDMQTWQELAQQCMRIARTQPEAEFALQGHRHMGASLFWGGKFLSARVHLEKTLARYDRTQHGALAFFHGEDPAVASLCYHSWLLWMLGYTDQARTAIRDALAHARELAHAYSLAFALVFATSVHQCLRDVKSVQEEAEELMTLSDEHGFLAFLAWSTFIQGWAVAEQGACQEGLAQMVQGETSRLSVGLEFARPYFHVLLSEGYGKNGQASEGLDLLDVVLRFVEQTGLSWFEAELHRLRGELLLMAEGGARLTEGTPVACFQRALDVARGQQAKSLELRAATSLARLWQSQGKRQEARELLQPVYGWFTEGFDTADLIEAKGMLKALHV